MRKSFCGQKALYMQKASLEIRYITFYVAERATTLFLRTAPALITLSTQGKAAKQAKRTLLFGRLSVIQLEQPATLTQSVRLIKLIALSV
jgi:hypothetical protein